MPVHFSSSCYRTSLIRAVSLTFHGVVALAFIAATLASPLHAQAFSAGLHFGGPVRAALAVGVIWMRPTGSDHGQGPILLAEPGLGGHRISAGYLFARGNLGQFASVRATGLALRRNGWSRYAGLDLQVQPLFVIGGRLGAFLPLQSAASRRLLWIADVSLGL